MAKSRLATLKSVLGNLRSGCYHLPETVQKWISQIKAWAGDDINRWNELGTTPDELDKLLQQAKERNFQVLMKQLENQRKIVPSKAAEMLAELREAMAKDQEMAARLGLTEDWFIQITSQHKVPAT